MTDGLNWSNVNLDSCIPCIKGKQSRQPFPKTSGRRAKDLLDIVHSDVCGTMSMASWRGSRYLLTFMDDLSRKSLGYMLKSTTETIVKALDVQFIENSKCTCGNSIPNSNPIDDNRIDSRQLAPAPNIIEETTELTQPAEVDRNAVYLELAQSDTEKTVNSNVYTHTEVAQPEMQPEIRKSSRERKPNTKYFNDDFSCLACISEPN
ncbi:uncharacterized protein LOC124594578 [Schistocerca americana]|uniref:uncharacterized protein LOC124594578 n=1 Tax=Schistocerca americana TaxID=7009 RepID=UPI001F5006C0|nr:uncharacterized protein LOC124594578 [Schistocerca americana]